MGEERIESVMSYEKNEKQKRNESRIHVGFHNLFLRVSRICFLIFFLILAIFVCFAVATKDDETTVPVALGILFLVSTFAALTCIIIAWILDLIENIRRDKFSYFIGYVALILILWGAFTAVDYFINHITGDWLGGFVRAFASVCTIKAANYIFLKKTDSFIGKE